MSTIWGRSVGGAGGGLPVIVNTEPGATVTAELIREIEITGRLPEGYTEVEYIESSGTQYIDTGMKVGGAYHVECKISHPTYTNLSQAVFCVDSGWGENGFGLLVESCEYGASFAHKAAFADGNIHILELDKGTVKLDGTTTYTAAQSSFVTDYNLYLFCLNRSGTAAEFSTPKMYYCKIWNDETLVRDYVPCTNADGVAGLYDLVNGVFYDNDGTGTFAVGAEVIEYETEVLKTKSGVADAEGKWKVRLSECGEWKYSDNSENRDDLFVEYPAEVTLPDMYEQFVNYTMLYDYGDECTDVTGGWDRAVATERADWRNGITQMTKQTNSFYGTLTNYNQCRYRTATRPIDTTPYSILGMVCKFNGALKADATFSLIGNGNASEINNTNTDYTILCGPGGATNVEKYIGSKDITTINKTMYPCARLFDGSASGGKGAAMWFYCGFMAKPDDYQTLCEIAGVDAPSTLTELIADTNKLASIFNSEVAVVYMVARCTGDFMVSLIKDSTALSYLSSSPYYATIQANEHWAKFLAMVA